MWHGSRLSCPYHSSSRKVVPRSAFQTMFFIATEGPGPGRFVTSPVKTIDMNQNAGFYFDFFPVSVFGKCYLILLVSVSFVTWRLWARCSKCKRTRQAREISGNSAGSITLVPLILNYNNSTCTAHVAGITKLMRKSN